MRYEPKFRGTILPFDLNQAFRGATLVTRDGHPVTNFRRVGDDLLGVVLGDQPCRWELTGSFPIQSTCGRRLDLCIGVPAKIGFFTRIAGYVFGGAQ